MPEDVAVHLKEVNEKLERIARMLERLLMEMRPDPEFVEEVRRRDSIPSFMRRP